MPGYFGEAYGDLSLRIEKFTAGLQQAVSQAQAAGQNISQAISGGASGAAKQGGRELQKFTYQVRGYIKDTSKVITGILISQGFYRTLNAIEDSIANVREFHDELDRASISFSKLLGSTQEAKNFIIALQQLAEETPFTFETAETQARRLLAMGFSYKNVIPILRDISDMAAITGQGAESIDRVTRALGQIRTKGRLVTQEMLQLTEAGVPAFEILQEELGLTREQLADLAKLDIPADVAIAAILRGINKRFSGAAKELEQTTGAIITRIGERLLYIADGLFGGAFDKLKGFLSGVADSLGQLLTALRTSGIEGFIKRLVPPSMEQSFKTLVASFIALGQSVLNLWVAIKPILSTAVQGFVKVGAIVLPIIVGLVNVISKLARWAQTSSPFVRALAASIASLAVANLSIVLVTKLYGAIRLLFVAGPVANLITQLARAIFGLNIVMTKNPIVATIMVISAALLALALSSKTVSQWLDRLIKQLGILGGFNIDQLLTPTDPADINKILQQYNEKLQDVMGDLSGVGDAAQRAGKKTKDTFIASFDEVHQIPEQLDSVQDAFQGITDGLDGIGNVKLPDLPDTGDLKGGGAEDNLGDLFKLPDKIVIPPIVFPDPPTTPPPGAVAEVIDTALTAIALAFAANEAKAAQWSVEIGKSLQAVVDKVRQWVSDTTEALREWPMQALQGVLQGLANTATAVSQWASNTWISISAWVTQTTTLLQQWATNVLTSVQQWVLNAAASIKQWALDTATTLGSWAISTVGTLGSWAREAASPIATWASQTAASIGAWISQTTTSIGQWAVDAAASVAGWASSAIGSVVQFGKDLPSKLWEGLQNAGKKLKEAFTGWLADWNLHHVAVVGIVALIVADIIGKFGGLPQGVKTAILGLITTVSGVFADMSAAMAAELGKAKTMAADRARSIKDAITDEFYGLINDAKEWGKSIVQGLWDGINGLKNWLRHKIRGWIKSVKSFFTEGFQISSPSEVMAQMGEQLTAGLAVGMRRNLSTLNGTVQDMKQSIQDQLASTMRVNIGAALTSLQGGVATTGAVIEGARATVSASTPVSTPTLVQPTAPVGNLGASGRTNSYEINVGTLVADELSLKILARKIKSYIDQENTRIA